MYLGRLDHKTDSMRAQARIDGQSARSETMILGSRGDTPKWIGRSFELFSTLKGWQRSKMSRMEGEITLGERSNCAEENYPEHNLFLGFSGTILRSEWDMRENRSMVCSMLWNAVKMSGSPLFNPKMLEAIE